MPARPAEIFDDPVRLPLDPVRQRRVVVVRIGGDLAGDEHPAIGRGSMAVWCDRLRRLRDHQKLDHGQSLEQERRESGGRPRYTCPTVSYRVSAPRRTRVEQRE